VVDELGAVGEVRADVVVVDRLLDEHPALDAVVHRSGCGIGAGEQRLAVDLAQHLALGLDDRVRPDHLQVEHEPTGLDGFDQVAQDVHDVLGLHSSERPREERQVERAGLDLDRLSGGDSIGDARGEIVRQGAAGPLDRLRVRVEREHRGRIGRGGHRQPPVTTAELDHPPAPKVGQPVERCEMHSLRIEDSRHRVSN
jgi:hypothetical protein